MPFKLINYIGCRSSEILQPVSQLNSSLKHHL